MHSRPTCKAANILIASAVVVLAIAAAIGVIDWQGAVSGRAFAVGALAAALGLAAVITNSRQVASHAIETVTDAVARAPRDAYYQGYGDASADALNGDI